MPKGYFAYENALDLTGAVVTTSGASASTHNDNLLDSNWRCYWESSASSGLYFLVVLDEPRAVRLFALIGHTCYSAGCDYVDLKVGSADDGSTFNIWVTRISMNGNPELEPHVCDPVYEIGNYVKRFWRVEFGGSGLTGLRVGYLLMALTAFENTQTTDAPFSTPWIGDVPSSRKIGGGQTRSATRDPARDTRLLWKNASSDERGAIRSMYRAQNGQEEAVVMVDHGVSGGFPCRFVRLADLREAEVSTGDRYEIGLTVEDVV